MSTTQPTRHFRWGIVLFTLEKRTSYNDTHTTYVACQRNLPVAIQQINVIPWSLSIK